MPTLDELIAYERKAAEVRKAEYEFECSRYGKKTVDSGEKLDCVKEYEHHSQLVELLEELKTIEKIMLIYNANWYADEDNGVPDNEVLESIWNVIQDNGLDIDIEQDYRKGKADGYNRAIDDFLEKIQWEYLNSCGIKQSEIEFLVTVSSQVAEQLKAGGENEDCV